MKLLGLNRIELLVEDPDAAENDLSALLGGLNFEREPAEGVLDCRVDWKAGIEIVHPEGDDHVVSDLLKERGQHIFTVVFEVEDIDDAKEWVQSQGFEIMYAFDNGTPEQPATIKQLSISPERTHGMLVTLLERIERKQH
ncbi:MAG: hypothetical protein AB8G23_03015 [Myxococcota bacterium]